eukprot:scaffold237497_cov58-Attheya_sp.AAC.3
MSGPTYDDVVKLLGHSAYNPAIVPQLEAYVKAQASSKAPYYFNANRTLVKLYQFFPHLSAGDEIISLVLFLALVEFPTTDFCALACLVPERVQSREPCVTLVRCAELLEACQFAEFWQVFGQIQTEAAASVSMKQAAASSETQSKLRKSILSLLAHTYRTAPLTMVLAALNVSSLDDGDAMVASVSGDTVTFVASPDNTKRSRVFKEGVNYDAISSMMTKTTTSAPVVARE